MLCKYTYFSFKKVDLKKISCCIIQAGDLIFCLNAQCYLLPSNILNVSVRPLWDVTARIYISEASPSIIRFSFPLLCRTVLPLMDIRSIFDTLSAVICIGEPTIGDAILDRLVHALYGIELKGESLRKTVILSVNCVF